jgi:CubicO group peptidase (beta-lactamase class C family)
MGGGKDSTAGLLGRWRERRRPMRARTGDSPEKLQQRRTPKRDAVETWLRSGGTRRPGSPCAVLGPAAARRAVAVAGCGASHAPSVREGRGPQLTPKLAHRLTADLRFGLAATNIPGVAAALVFPDGREWSGAAGAADLRPRAAMTPHTAFPFDGVTDVATAALAMRLAEQRRLRLDDPIRRWYPA